MGPVGYDPTALELKAPCTVPLCYGPKSEVIDAGVNYLLYKVRRPLVAAMPDDAGALPGRRCRLPSGHDPLLSAAAPEAAKVASHRKLVTRAGVAPA